MNRSGYALGSPASKWEEGMLCGNGEMGAIVMGDAKRERIILSHEKLFVPVHERMLPVPMAAHLPNIRALLAQGKYKEAGEYAYELHKREHGDAIVWTNPFFPACELIIDTPIAENHDRYERSLNFARGEATIRFAAGRVRLERKLFVSRASGVCVLQLLAEGGRADYDLSLDLLPLDDELIGKSNIKDRGIFLPTVAVVERALVFTCRFRERALAYRATALIHSCDGEVIAGDRKLSIRSAHSVTLLLSLQPLEAGDLKNSALDDDMGRLASPVSSYSELLHDHERVHGERYGRITLKLADDSSEMDDQALWQQTRLNGPAAPLFLEKIFHAGRYAILSSCGKTPPNLQGIWAGDYYARWSGDYTQNGNVQTAILALLPTGDFESMLSYFDYQESLLDDYRINSRILYGCRGIHVPSRTSDHGLDVHFNSQYPHLFWTAGAGWVAHFYYEFWLYTGDDAFFRDRALPLMKEAALFYEDFLIEDTEGKWLFSPSFSPENRPANTGVPTCVNATMDIAVAKQLLTNLITGCRTLGMEEPKIGTWERMLARMPEYLVNEEGAMKEWTLASLEDRYDHRHVSHLYMLFDGIPDEWKRNPELFAACEKAYRIKAERKKHEQGTMAFGLVQLGMAAAHLGDADMVEIMLQSMAANNYYGTYASSHDYGPSTFNADISGGLPALMLAAIAQSMPIVDDRSVIVGYEIKLPPLSHRPANG